MRTWPTQPLITPASGLTGVENRSHTLMLKLLGWGFSPMPLHTSLSIVVGSMLKILMGNVRSQIFASVRGPTQTGQNSLIWRGDILALQALSSIHVGIDNLNVLRGVAKLMDKGSKGVSLLLLSSPSLSPHTHHHHHHLENSQCFYAKEGFGSEVDSQLPEDYWSALSGR